MKDKKYLHCQITAHSGMTFNNPLKLSEAHLVSRIAQENKSVVVTIRTVDIANYKSIFG